MLQQPVGQAIGWALLQFVWQGALVGAADGRRCWRRCAAAPPTSATSSSTIALALMLTMPVVTAVQTLASAPTRGARTQTRAASAQIGDAAESRGRSRRQRCRAARPIIEPRRTRRPLAGASARRCASSRWLPLFVLGLARGRRDADAAAAQRLDVGRSA